MKILQNPFNFEFYLKLMTDIQINKQELILQINKLNNH